MRYDLQVFDSLIVIKSNTRRFSNKLPGRKVNYFKQTLRGFVTITFLVTSLKNDSNKILILTSEEASSALFTLRATMPDWRKTKWVG